MEALTFARVAVAGTAAAFAAASAVAALAVAAVAVAFGIRAPCSPALYVMRAVRTDPPRPPSSAGSVVAASSASAEIPPALGKTIDGRRDAAERRSCEYIADSRSRSPAVRSRSG